MGLHKLTALILLNRKKFNQMQSGIVLPQNRFLLQTFASFAEMKMWRIENVTSPSKWSRTSERNNPEYWVYYDKLFFCV